MFRRIITTIMLRRASTAVLVAALQQIDRAQDGNPSLRDTPRITEGRQQIYRELVRRGDQSLV